MKNYYDKFGRWMLLLLILSLLFGCKSQTPYEAYNEEPLYHEEGLYKLDGNIRLCKLILDITPCGATLFCDDAMRYNCIKNLDEIRISQIK